MFNFIQKFIYWILSIQEQVLRKNLKRTLKSSYGKSTTKALLAKSDSVRLTGQTEKNKQKLDFDVKSVIKKYANDPEKLLKFVAKKGTHVCKIPHAKVLLGVIGYEEGFIGHLTGFKALYLTVVLTILAQQVGISLNTKPMFVLSNKPVDSCNMIQQFHKWYAMKLNLPGFDAEAQQNFQKFLGDTKDEDIKSLSLDEILGLKEAIARDVEAINFVVEMAKSIDGSRQAMCKITAGGASV